MTALELGMELWPLAAFLVTVLITIVLNSQSSKSLDKRIVFLEGLLTRQTISADKASERFFELAKAKVVKETGKPLSEDSEEALKIASGTASTLTLSDLDGYMSFLGYDELLKSKK